MFLYRNIAVPFVQSVRSFRYGGVVQRHIKPRDFKKFKRIVQPNVKIDPLEKCADDQPLQLVVNPYEKPKKQCILCKYGIKLNYKNTRLLSQFISTFSGRVYERHITGLCAWQEYNVLQNIRTARAAGLMPIFNKDPRLMKDPRLFDPMNPQRPNPY